MEVALTFGSLGDIIAVCQLAIQLGRAIGVGSGAVGNSAKEYQDFREDLDSFVRILMQVVATYQQHEPSPYLNGLDSTAKSIIDQCGSLIQDTLEHVHPKYHDSLRVAGSGKKVKDIYRKVEWMTRETDRLRHVREKLQDGVQRLSLLTTLAARKSARVDNATLCARIEEINRLVSNTCHSREEILKLLRDQGRASEKQADKLEDVSQQLVVQEESGRDILGLAKATFCGILETKALLLQISQTVINLQVMASHSIYLHPLDPTKELPVVLEDALGNELPLPAEWLDSLEWEVLYQLLTGRFKDRKGYDMVLKREFALEDSSSGRDLDTNRPLHFCLRRGMKINMSMVFDAATVVAGACPRCHTVTDAPEDVTVQCMRPDCGMWFRMQSIVIEASETSDTLQGSDVKSVPTGQRSTIVTSIPVEPADFQRVRLLRQETSGLQPASTQIDMNLEPGSLARHSPLPITASASKGEGEEFRTNPYPAPPIYGQRNDDSPFAPNPQGYNPNGYDPRFQYHSTNVYFQPPYINPFPQVVPPFAPTANPLNSRYYRGPFPYPDHTPHIPSPHFNGSPMYSTAPRNDYNYIAEYEDISSTAATVGSQSTSSTSSSEKEVKGMKRDLRKARHNRHHEKLRREKDCQLPENRRHEELRRERREKDRELFENRRHEELIREILRQLSEDRRW